MFSLTEFEGKKKKKNPTHKSKSLTQWFEREKKRLNLLNCVFSGSRRLRERERKREASWGIFGGFSEYAEALGNSRLGKFSLFISQSLNFFFFLPNYWVKDLFLWLEVWFFIQIQLGMTLFRFFLFSF